MVSVGYALAVFASPCVECGEVSDEGEALIKKWGLDPANYTVVFSWEERAHNGSNAIIKGMRVAPTSGGDPFDIYADALETRLGPGDLASLRIAPKDWSLIPLSVNPELSPPTKATAAAAPATVPTPRAAPRVKLPTLNREDLLAEDATALSDDAKAARRIGVFQAVPGHLWVAGETASVGSWETLPDGRRVWAATIEAPGARGQRLHVTELALPEGGHIYVQNAAVPAEAFGPFTSLPASGELWTPTCFGERVTIICSLPADADVARTALRVDRIVHIYADIATLPYRKAKAGTCNLDIVDYPEWVEMGSGVGGIGSVTSRGAVWCTGSLVADALPGSQHPLFLTANHCVRSQGSAESIEIYWLYDSGNLNLLTVPRTTGGADMLATSAEAEGNDMTLLRLRNHPPDGLTFLGWTTDLPQAQEEIVTIHHPDGDYKRISFGHIIDRDAGFHTVQWAAGTTEPGSSGSPLLTQEGMIIGQLYGGLASCAQPLSPDYYGRFDAGWPVLRQWLTDVTLPWDIDGSGHIDAVDLQLVVRGSLRVPMEYNSDVNDSGRVDAVDVQLVILALLNEILP
jgi:hypothetical protein